MNKIIFMHDEGDTASTVTPSHRRLIVDHNCIVYERRDDGRNGPWYELRDAKGNYSAAIDYMEKAR